MIDEASALDGHIRRQAEAHAAMSGDRLEHVAASLVRIDGFLNRGTGASGHCVDVDEPVVFGGGGTAADPAELLLIAIAASLSVTLTVHASLAGLTLHGVDIGLAGKLDADRFFEPVDGPGGGFFGLRIEVTLSSEAPRAAVQALLDRALLASPVLRSIAGVPTVTLTLNRG